MIQAMTMPASLTAENGSSVALRAAESGEVLETRDQNGRLVFEFDTVTGKGVLHLG